MKPKEIIDWKNKPATISAGFDGELLTSDVEDDFVSAAGCGTRPICAFTKNCQTKQAAWQACVAANSAVKVEGKFGSGTTSNYSSPSTTSSPSNTSSSGMSTGAIIGIVAAVAGIGGLAWYLLRK